jgi:hypothetical protein
MSALSRHGPRPLMHAQVRWWGFALQDIEFTRTSYQDLLFTMASILLCVSCCCVRQPIAATNQAYSCTGSVWLYISIHTGSIFIGSLGMLQIILTLPVSLFVYRGIFRVTFFNQLHVLAIYLVLGIGADDIFVFVDGWRQSVNQYKNTADRLDQTYKRAMKAMGATSATTCVAFIATAINPIMPISSFGIYAALGIFFNYVLTMTLFPCILMLWHYRAYGCAPRPGHRGCCCFHQPFTPPFTAEARIGQSPEELEKVDPDAQDTAEPEEVLGLLERFFQNTYAPFVIKKPVAASLVVIWLAFIIFSMVMALQLEPPTEQEEWFPDDHMFQQVQNRMKDFMSDAADSYVEVRLAFGLKGMNREDTNFWEPCCLEDGKRGKVDYDTAFDLSTSVAQTFFDQTCDALMAASCSKAGCEGGRLVSPPRQGDTTWCWIKPFIAAYPVAQRTGAAFIPAVTAFRAANPAMASSIGLAGTQLKYATIVVRATLKQFQPNEKTEPVFGEFERFISARIATAPAGMGSMVHSGGVFWTWTFTEKELVKSVFRGFAICFPAAFIVLMLATRNIVVSVLAIISVMGIVAAVMGFCKWAMDWGLGIGESIAAVILVGFSVDYVVHLAHMYVHAGHQMPPINAREDRVTYALKSMGVTVLSGAITTFGSGLMLVFTQLTFFVKFSQLIMLTIGVSILIALTFFIPALVLIGPEGTFGDMSHFCRKTDEEPPPAELLDSGDNAKMARTVSFAAHDQVAPAAAPRPVQAEPVKSEPSAPQSDGYGSPSNAHDGTLSPGGAVFALSAVSKLRGTHVNPRARQIFDEYDADRTGTLSKDEVMSMIAGMDFHGVTPEYVDGVWGVYDRNRDGVLGPEEFQRFFTVLESRHSKELQTVANPLAYESGPEQQQDGAGFARLQSAAAAVRVAASPYGTYEPSVYKSLGVDELRQDALGSQESGVIEVHSPQRKSYSASRYEL